MMADPAILAPIPNHTIDAVADRMAELSDTDLDFQDDADAGQKVETAAEQEASRGDEDSEPSDDRGSEDVQDEAGAEPASEDEAEEEDVKSAEEDSADGDVQDVLEITLGSGETAEVPTSELAKLYENSQEVSAAREKIVKTWQGFEKARSAEVERISAMGKEIVERLQYLQKINVVGEAPSPAMLDPSSQQYDPDNYHLQRANYEQRQEIDKRIKADLGAVQTLQTQERDRAVKSLIAAETLKTKDAWPEIVSPGEVGDKARSELINGAREYYSINKDEISQIADSRQLSVLRDALAYRRMTEKAPSVQKKLANKPRLIKPGAKETKKSRAGRNVSEARKRLKKSGSARDAMALFENFNL